MKLGRIIKDRRKYFKYSQAELARLTRISKSYLCELEKGGAINPSIDVLKEISRVLVIDLNLLINGKKPADDELYILLYSRLTEDNKEKIKEIINILLED